MGRKTYNFAWLIFIPALILVCLGLVTLASLDAKLFYQQLVMVIISFFLFVAFSRIDFSLYKYVDKYIYILGIIFLLLSFLGPNVRGATRWLELGFTRLQPSELMKPFFLITFASFLKRYPPKNIKNILRNFGLVLLPFLLILKQPDLGNAIVYLISFLSMLIIAGIPLIYVLLGGIFSSIITPFFYKIMQDYQKLRILMFVNPNLDPKGAGYNAIQSIIAVGSGLWLGRGFGRGTQSLLKFLPEYQTDFIFASFCEEFGFVGGAILVFGFCFMLWQILKSTFSNNPESLANIFIAGIFTQLLVQIVINMGMNLGILPITGITLPFVSLGGSSMIATWINLGILFAAIQKHEDTV